MSSFDLLTNLIVDGFVTGCIYALIAIGFSLMWWASNVVHLAHGGVLLAVGFTIYIACGVMGLPLPIGVLLALAVGALLGLAIDRLIYTPLHRRRTDEMGMLTASLGLLIVIEFALVIGFGPDGHALNAGWMRRALAPQIILVLDGFAVAAVTTTLMVFVLLGYFMHFTMAGKRMQAVAQNPDLAKVLGINIISVGRQVAVLSAILVVPAALLLLFSTGIRPIEAVHIVLIAAIVAIIGGRGSILGALIAGLLVGIAESVTVWYLPAGWRLLVTFVILYAVLLIRPQGLFGSKAA